MMESKPSNHPLAISAPTARTASWAAVSIIALLLGGIGVFLGLHIESAIDAATAIARPHEVQTQLEHVKATVEALEDSIQDFMIDGSEQMRTQHDDSVRTLGAEMAELSALSTNDLSAVDRAEIDERISRVLSTSRGVIEARRSGGAEAARGFAEVSLAALNGAKGKLDSLIASQQDVLRQRERTLRWHVAQMFGGLMATGAIVLCLLAGAVALVENDRRRQVAAQDYLRSENERLESAVRERSATLAQANRELTWFSKRALQIQEHERRALALELHDQIGQELASLVLSLTRCEREMPPDPRPELRSAVQDSIEIARAAYGDVHNLALDLRPAMLDRLGLIPTLQWYARQQARHARCEIAVEADTFPVELPPDLLIAAFRIVQEAVSNAVRHANPRRIEIRAHYRPGRIELQVQDDGVGFDPALDTTQQEPRMGLGLVGMRQRAQDVGGNVSIRSRPGSGTQIVALLSIPEST
jgi:signal transduction histidine kinase